MWGAGEAMSFERGRTNRTCAHNSTGVNDLFFLPLRFWIIMTLCCSITREIKGDYLLHSQQYFCIPRMGVRTCQGSFGGSCMKRWENTVSGEEK